MYQFRNAVCLSRSIGSQWRDINLSTILVYDIYASYSKVYLVLFNTVLNRDVYVDMDTMRLEFSSYNDTLANLLIQLADRALATVQTLPNQAIKYVKYGDIFQAEYKVKLTRAGLSLPDNYPDSEKHDLEITRPKYITDLSLIHSHCLVSVNGHYHMTDSDGERAFVLNGAVTMRKGGNNQMGLLSFLDIGAIKKVKLKKENIVGQSPTSPLKEKIFFSVDEDLENKSYILVLGGYLVLPTQGVFWRNGQSSFALDLNQLPYAERIFESGLNLDLSGLGLTSQEINPNLVNVEELLSDSVIRNYMTLSQSFLVVVSTTNMVSNKIFLRHSSSPGMFTSYIDPVYPLLVGNGKVAEYWKVQEDGFWSVNVQDSYWRNYIISQQPIRSIVNANDHLVSSQPFKRGRGYMLELGCWNAV